MATMASFQMQFLIFLEIARKTNDSTYPEGKLVKMDTFFVESHKFQNVAFCGLTLTCYSLSTHKNGLTLSNITIEFHG